MKERSDNGIKPVESIPANLTLTKEIDLKDVVSYAGYASSKGNHMFCWFFRSQKCMRRRDAGNHPLLIWLNGGPGASSSMGLLLENGPYLMEFVDTGTIVANPYSWNREAHVMYWDNPVGAGYSYNEDGFYVNNETDLGERFYEALQVFFREHPEYRDCQLYITGESYAGKYIPSIATTIMKKNEASGKSKDHINLKGLAIGNPWMYPLLQTKKRVECGYELGFLDTKQHKILMGQCGVLKKRIDEGKWRDAFELNQHIKKELIACGGGIAIYDVRIWDYELSTSFAENYFRLDAVKEALHVPEGQSWEAHDETGPVTEHLIEDFVSNTVDYLPPLLKKKGENGKPAYRVLLYTGNLDMSCGFKGTEEILYNLRWGKGNRAAWRALDRRVWAAPRGRTLGYIKSHRNLTQIVIPCSGHLVPMNQPEVSLEMANNFVFEREFPSYRPLG